IGSGRADMSNRKSISDFWDRFRLNQRRLRFWLTLWTFGGIAAGRELLRLLFGRDRFLVNYDGLEVEQSFGLFRLVKRFPREHTDLAPVTAYSWTDPDTGIFYGTNARIFQSGEEMSGIATSITAAVILGRKEPSIMAASGTGY